MPPIVVNVQSPPQSLWSLLAGPIIGLLGVGLGLFLGAIITRHRERGHFVWQQQCELYMELLEKAHAAVQAVIAFPEGPLDKVEPVIDDKRRAFCAVFAQRNVMSTAEYMNRAVPEWQHAVRNYKTTPTDDALAPIVNNGRRCLAAYNDLVSAVHDGLGVKERLRRDKPATTGAYISIPKEPALKRLWKWTTRRSDEVTWMTPQEWASRNKAPADSDD